ncbi:hypothetical protein MPER_02000 [Moniliophthora perniciosa FA553]|nr:hypothetical protein MPER_02000 [Moniliophthora perniciosa FA553]
MTEYRQIGQWKSSAEKYQYHWKKADRVVPTLCDAVAEHLGVGVLLTTFGPMADGEIDVRSVCALVPDAQTKQTLAQFNLEGLTKTHQMCQEYAQALFSKEQCLSRIPTTEDVEGDQDDSSAVTAVPISTTPTPTTTNPSTAKSSARPSNPIPVNHGDSLNPTKSHGFGSRSEPRHAGALTRSVRYVQIINEIRADRLNRTGICR